MLIWLGFHPTRIALHDFPTISPESLHNLGLGLPFNNKIIKEKFHFSLIDDYLIIIKIKGKGKLKMVGLIA